MTTEAVRAELLAFVSHLNQHPEDLRDIRRLQKTYRLSALESARLLEVWDSRDRIAGRPEAG